MTLNSRLTEILELAEKLERQEISRIDYAAFSLRLIPQLVEALKLAIEQRDNCIKYLNPATGIDDSVQINLMNERLEPILRRV